MKTKARVRVSLLSSNHNETLARDASKATDLRVKTRVKADLISANHTETLVPDKRRKG